MNEIVPITHAGGEGADFAMSEGVEKLFAALAKAQASDLIAGYNRQNDAFKQGGRVSRYADLAAVWETVRAALPAQGLAVVQFPSTRGKDVSVRTMIGHDSGQWIASTITASASDLSPQKIGSAITYLKRYGLCAMVGVVADADDDGNEASGRNGADARDLDRRPPAPPAGSMRDYAQSLQGQRPTSAAAPGKPVSLRFTHPNGDVEHAAAANGQPAEAVWVAWARDTIGRAPDAEKLKGWWNGLGRDLQALRQHSPDAEKAATDAYYARLANLDDSIPIPREPAMAGGG